MTAKGVAARRAQRPIVLVDWLTQLVRVPEVGFTRDQLIACAKLAHRAYTLGRKSARNTMRVRARRVRRLDPITEALL